MDGLKLSENIIRLRHERKITQEELADFLGVTKASVSKWENAQSTPDLLLLLQLSAFFDMTIDELIGYKPQLSRDRIRCFYAELAKDFAERSFHEALEKARTLAHRYYSCYPFLLQLCILYLNHYMLAETKKEQEQVLKEAVSWCDHILKNSSDVGLCSDALVLKAGISLHLGNGPEVISMLETVSDPTRLVGQEGMILVQAYQMTGENEKARDYIQMKEYADLLNLVNDAVISLVLFQNNPERCRETAQRVGNIMEQYQMDYLHPNMAAQFHYQTAVVYAANGEDEAALNALCHFEKCVDRLLQTEKALLHGDEYFDRLDIWINRLPLGNMMPRSRKFIFQNLQAAFCHPAFEKIKDNPGFQRMIQHFSN